MRLYHSVRMITLSDDKSQLVVIIAVAEFQYNYAFVARLRREASTDLQKMDPKAPTKSSLPGNA